MRGLDDASRRGEAPGEDFSDEGLTVESLDPETETERAARRGRLGGRLGEWLTARALARPGRRITPRARALRVGVVVIVIAATLFAQLDGAALVGDGWSRLTAALRGQPDIPPLAMTGWQTMDLPVSAGATVTPDPLNPAIMYACEVNGTAVMIWKTDSGGRIWQGQMKTTVSPPASACRVKMALDAPTTALMVVYARDPSLPGCERLTLYSGSGSDPYSGEKWTPAPLPGYPGACLGDVWPSASALYYWWTNARGGQALTGLARSDDQGKSWSQVPIFPFDPHFSLAPALLESGSGDTIMTQVYLWPGPGQHGARNEVWRSLDGGFSWRRAPNAPLGAQLFTSTEPTTLRDIRWPPTYAAVFNAGELSPPWVPNYAPATIQALRADGASWAEAPPLPLEPSQTPQSPPPLGITDVLAVGPGGTLLALGEKPGAVATLNPQRELWLWAWDPAAQKWRVGAQAPNGVSLAGLTWANGPAGGPYAHQPGAYLWLTGEKDGQQALYSTFIPTAQGNASG